jgi:hypothetical protein
MKSKLGSLLFLLLSPVSLRSELVIHEWGTFTSLQDEAGQSIGGINTDDEPVPRFVHRLGHLLLLQPTEIPTIFFQGAPRCHPDVTMRLETPVTYFHLPEGGGKVENLTVSVDFRGGWLTEFYPNAEAKADGIERRSTHFGPLRSATMSSLTWSNLSVGGNWSGLETKDHVWTAPREVRAASVRTAAGEAEKFLFYRGVAHIEAPITVTQNAHARELELRGRWPTQIPGDAPAVKFLWLADIKPDRKVAFRVLPWLTLEPKEHAMKVSSDFSAREYSAENIGKLRASLHATLLAEGLFADEAQALLNTWELSYFKSPGRRLFFIVPPAWTDFHLPLRVSTAPKVTRVMVGRIELVTPEQRRLLRQLAAFSEKQITNEVVQLGESYFEQIRKQRVDLASVVHGERSLSSRGVIVPESYKAYLSLGRFRNALILDEARKRPAPGLDSFISTYRLQAYDPVQPGKTAR